MVFTGFLICPKNMGTIDPQGMASLDPRSFIGRVYVVDHWPLLLKFFPLKTGASLAGFM